MVKQKLKGFSRDAMLYGLGDALGRLVGLVMFPILSRVFVPGDYGAIDLLTVSFAFLSTVVQFGIPSGVQRFYYRYDDHERKVVVSSCALLLLGIATSIGGAVALTAPWLALAVPERSAVVVEGIRLLGLTLPFMALWELGVLLLRLERRAVAFSLANVMRTVITPVVTVITVVQMQMGITGVFVAQLVATIIVALTVMGMVRGRLAAQVRMRSAVEALVFGLPGHPAVLINQVMNLLPRYVLAAFAPMQAVGLLGVGVRIGGVQRVLIAAFQRAWNPFAYANEGAEDERRLYEIATKGLVGTLATTTLLLSIFAPELLALLAPQEYAVAAHLVPGLALVFSIQGLTTIYSTILYTRGAVSWTSYLATVNIVVFLLLSLVLVPRFAADGLVVAMVAGAVAQTVGYVWAADRRFRIPVPWFRVVVHVGLSAGILWGGLALSLPTWATVGLKLVGVLASVLVAYVLLFSRGERASIREALSRVVPSSTSAVTP